VPRPSQSTLARISSGGGGPAPRRYHGGGVLWPGAVAVTGAFLLGDVRPLRRRILVQETSGPQMFSLLADTTTVAGDGPRWPIHVKPSSRQAIAALRALVVRPRAGSGHKRGSGRCGYH